MAAAAGALPSPVQSLAYDVFGDLGVPPPGPSPHHAPGNVAGHNPYVGLPQSASATPSAGPTGTPTAVGPTSAPATLSPTALCQLAVRSLTVPGALDSADLAQLSADAGGYLDIPKYCASVLKSAGIGGNWPPEHFSPPAAPVTTSPGYPQHSPTPAKTTAPAHQPRPTPRATDAGATPEASPAKTHAAKHQAGPGV